jgi:hypothetical protein
MIVPVGEVGRKPQEAGEVDGTDPPGPGPGMEEGNLGGGSRLG